MTDIPNPEQLPAVVPLQVASRVLGIGKNAGYLMAHDGSYPVRVLRRGRRFVVSKYDLLGYLHATPRDT